MIEVDFHEVVSKKLQVLKKNENLIGLIRSESELDIPVIHEKHINSY